MPSFFGLDTGAVLRLRMSDDDAGMTNDLVRSLPLRRPGQPNVTLPTTTERVGRYGGMPERVSYFFPETKGGNSTTRQNSCVSFLAFY